ncbi:MAG: glycosyltransferase [Terriglobales bacterium]
MDSHECVPEPKITFVVSVNNREIFENNFLVSPCLRGANDHEIVVQERFLSAPTAYNDALGRSSNDLIVFCHQDVYLPVGWLKDLRRALDYLSMHDPNWGVLGCSGMTVNHDHWRYLYSSGLGVSGTPFEHPKPIQTLDEIVLILRKSSGLRFDEQLPYFHLYGTDICLQALQRGMNSYAISAFCIHNTHQTLVLPTEFYECCKHIRRTWSSCLPIQTTCVRITAFNIPIYARRLHETYLRHIRRKEIGGMRVKDVRQLVEECAQATNRPQPPLGSCESS